MWFSAQRNSYEMSNLIFLEKKKKKKKLEFHFAIILLDALMLTTLWANSADDKLVIFSPENGIWNFMPIVCTGDSLHEMSNPVFWEK